MKKYFFLALTAIVSLVFAACSEDLSSLAPREGEVDVTYTVSTLSTPNSRATHDGDGNAKNVNRYICEVWNVESDGALTLYKRIENVVGSGTLNTTFTLRLVSKQSYKVLFWADHAEVVGVGEVDGNNITAADIYYDTKTAKGLQEVTLKTDENSNYVGNNDEMDAFFAVETINNLNGTVDKTSDDNHVVLKRPFAQLNVITTDIDDIRKNAVTSTMNPNKIKMTVNAPTKFNVLTGEATAEEDIEYTAAVYYNISGVNKKADDSNYSNSYAYCTLAMNYYFAPADEKAVETVNLVALNGDKELVSPVFANIPLQRNYRTNIIGDLFTDAVNYKVEINPIWDGEKYVNITRVDNIEAANQALAEGKTDLEITMPTDAASQNVVFTSANNAQNITLNFSGAVVGNTVTIRNDASASGPASVNITAPSGTNLVFQNETHVVINGTNYGTISGSFSANTLVISEGVTVQTLAPTKGKIEIHGTVNTLNLEEGSTVTFGKSENLSEAMKTQIGEDKLAEGFVWKKNTNNSWDIVRYVAAKIGNTEYATLQAAIEAATANDVIELFEGEYTTYGTTYAKNKTLHFKGIEGETIWKYGKNASVNGEGGSDYSFEGSNVTFKDITLEDNFTVNSYYRGFVRARGLTFENCTLKNMMGYLGVGDVHFTNCVFDVASTCEYAVKCYSGKNFYFDNCTFKGNNKANIQLYIQDKSETVHYVQVKDCKFYRGTDKSRTAVYYYDQGATEGGIWEIHLDGNNENLGEIAANTDSGSWLWGSMKYNTPSSKTKVYVGETLVWANGAKVN